MKFSYLLSVFLFSLFLVLPVTADEDAPEVPDVPITGSVETSSHMSFLPSLNNQLDSFLVGTNQIGLGGNAEATIGAEWEDWGFDPLDWFKGYGETIVHSASPSFNACAQVVKVERDYVNKGGTSKHCGQLFSGDRISAAHYVRGLDIIGLTWKVFTWHEVSNSQNYWAPSQDITTNP